MIFHTLTQYDSKLCRILRLFLFTMELRIIIASITWMSLERCVKSNEFELSQHSISSLFFRYKSIKILSIMWAAFEQKSSSKNVHNRRKKIKCNQIIKTIETRPNYWDGWNIYIRLFRHFSDCENHTHSNTKEVYFGTSKISRSLISIGISCIKTEINPIKNNIFCINSFWARNPIMLCNYWMWISCDRFGCCRMNAAAPLSFSLQVHICMQACMCLYIIH